MKNAIILLLIAATTFLSTSTVQAQAPIVTKSNTVIVKRNSSGTVVPIGNDTLTDGDNGSMSTYSRYSWNLTFKLNITRRSGTLAGYATLNGTDDTTNGPWYPIKGTRTECNTCVDSLATFTNAATNSFTWKIPHAQFLYYRVNYWTTGTVTATFNLLNYFNY